MVYLIVVIGVVFMVLSYGWLVRVFLVVGLVYIYICKMLSVNFGFMVGWVVLFDYFFILMLIWLFGVSYFNMVFLEVL